MKGPEHLLIITSDGKIFSKISTYKYFDMSSSRSWLNKIRQKTLIYLVYWFYDISEIFPFLPNDVMHGMIYFCL